MFNSLFSSLTVSEYKFKSIFNEQWMGDLNLMMESKFRSNFAKVVFMAEVKLDVFYILRGGSFEKRLTEIKILLNEYFNSDKDWILIYILFSEKNIKITTSKNMDYLSQILPRVDDRNIFNSNLQKELLYYIQEVLFQLEEFSYNPYWT